MSEVYYMRISVCNFQTYTKYAKFSVQKKYVFKICEFQFSKKGRHRGMRISKKKFKHANVNSTVSEHANFNVISMSRITYQLVQPGHIHDQLATGGV